MEQQWQFDMNIIMPGDEQDWMHGNAEAAKKYGADKYAIAQRFQPKRILEIGVRAGYSAYCFLSACPDAFYLGVDIEYSKYTPYARKILSKFANVNMIIVDSQMINDFHFAGGFDMIHIDGNHDYKPQFRDMEMSIRNLADNGVMVVDDYWINSTVQDACKDFLIKYPQYQAEVLTTINGDLLITKKTK